MRAFSNPKIRNRGIDSWSSTNRSYGVGSSRMKSKTPPKEPSIFTPGRLPSWGTVEHPDTRPSTGTGSSDDIRPAIPRDVSGRHANATGEHAQFAREPRFISEKFEQFRHSQHLGTSVNLQRSFRPNSGIVDGRADQIDHAIGTQNALAIQGGSVAPVARTLCVNRVTDLLF